MSRHVTIDPNESLTFFMGSWRDMYLNESEFSESEMSSEGGGVVDNSSFSSVDSGCNNNNTNNNNNSSRSSLTKVMTLSSSRYQIPDDWFNADEKVIKKSLPNPNSISPRKKPSRSKSADLVGPIFSPRKQPSCKSIESGLSTLTSSTSNDNNSSSTTTRKVPSRENSSSIKNQSSQRKKLSRSKSSGEVDNDDDIDNKISVPLTTKVSKNKKSVDGSGKENYAVNKKKFRSIINIDPYSGEIISASKIKTLTRMLKDYPELCTERYTFNTFPDEKIYPFHMLCALAAPVTCIKRCYKNFPQAINDDSSGLGTAIHYACAFHYNYFPSINKDDSKKRKDQSGGSTLAVVQYLIKKHANMLRVLNKQNLCTALHLACAAPYFTSISAELDDSSSDSSSNDDDKNNKDCREQIVTYLTSVCKKITAVVDQDRNTALHIACSVDEPSIEIIQHLCTIAPQTSLSTNTFGSTPLHLLVDTNDDNDGNLNKYVKLLIRTNDTSLRILDGNGEIPLHIALRAMAGAEESDGQYNTKVIKQLIKAYPESLYVKNQNGREPYSYAKSLKLGDDILELLMAKSKR
jgi:CTP-dependent riboflavin kinase